MASTLTRIRWTAFTALHCVPESRIPYLSSDELEARQSARLRAMVHHAWRSVPFYKRWLDAAGAHPSDIRSAADLSRLPLVDKLALTVNPEQFTAAGSEGRDGLTLLSSGTSGLRRTFRYDTAALFQALAAGRRQRLAMRPLVGREAAYRETVINREGCSGDQIRRFWEARMFNPKTLDLHRSRPSPALPFHDLLAHLNEFRPHVLRGIGSHVGAFLRWVVETGQRFEKPRVVSYGADAMPDADRRLIEEDLGIPVVSTYQAIEAIRIAFQCEARGGFHISMDQAAVRVVGADGRDVGPGERGELILSNLTNRATVVLNYRLGDLVTRGASACPCGRTLPLIESIDGRLDDLITRPDGTRLHALAFLAQLQAVSGVHQVQIIQEEMDAFRLRVVWARHAEPRPALLRDAMTAVLGPGIRAEIEAVEFLEMEPSGKVKTVVTQVRPT